MKHSLSRPPRRLRRFGLWVLLVSALVGLLSTIPIAPAEANFWNSWRNWFGSYSARRRIGGVSRGDGFCPVAPLPDAAQVWSDRPSLVWQGGAAQVMLESASGQTYPVSEPQQLTVIDGSAPIAYAVTTTASLPPGQYQWIVLSSSSISARDFEMMSAAERQQVSHRTLDFEVMPAAARQQLSQTLDQFPNTTDGAMQRADFFAGQNLWADFWQTAMAAPDLSADWRNVNSSTIAVLCPVLEVSESLPSQFSKTAEDGSPYMEHRLAGEAGQTVEMILESPELNTRLDLFSPSGNRLEMEQNTNIAMLSETGAYKIRVSSNEPQKRGDYTLRVIRKYGE